MSASAKSYQVVRSGASSRGRGGFSLLEMLVVMSIIVTVLGMASLGLQGFNRDRQGALAAIRGSLETARAAATARKTDVYVAFATGGPRDPESRFRRFALFIPDPDQPRSDPRSENIFERDLVGISEWEALPEGILFAVGKEFEGGAGADFATIMEAPGEFRRKFDYGPDHRNTGEKVMVEMPFFLFNARGMLEMPPVFGERFHRIGVVEAAYQQGTSSYGVADRIHLGWQQAASGQGKVPRAACLALHASTGRPVTIKN